MAPPKRKTPSPPPVVVKALETPAERQEAYEAIVGAFPNVPAMGAHLKRAIWQGPQLDPRHTRLTLVEGKIASVVVLAPRTVRFGPARIPAMTVGPVATVEAFRGKGYASLAMNDASRFMAQEGALLAYLAGARDLYCRFGYYGFRWPAIGKVAIADARQAMQPGSLRAMTRADLPHLARLYEQAMSRQVLTAVRDGGLWDWLLRFGSQTWLFPQPKAILDARKRLCGYLTLNSGAGLNLSEIVVRDDPGARAAALGALCRAAARKKAEEFTLPVVWDEPFAAFLRQQVGLMCTFHCKRGGGQLLKIVNFPKLLKALTPCLNERLRAGGSKTGQTVFTLACELGSVTLELRAGKVHLSDRPRGPRAWIPQQWLTGLLTGCHAAREILVHPQVKVPRQVLPWLERLFPAGYPFVQRGDNY